MKLATVGGILIWGYLSQLFAQHDVSGDIDSTGILLGLLVAAVAAATVLGYTWVRLDADRARRYHR